MKNYFVMMSNLGMLYYVRKYAETGNTYQDYSFCAYQKNIIPLGIDNFSLSFKEAKKLLVKIKKDFPKFQNTHLTFYIQCI